jgi:hypothetical protein
MTTISATESRATRVAALFDRLKQYRGRRHHRHFVQVTDYELFCLQDLVDDEISSSPRLRALQQRLHAMTGEEMPRPEAVGEKGGA